MINEVLPPLLVSKWPDGALGDDLHGPLGCFSDLIGNTMTHIRAEKNIPCAVWLTVYGGRTTLDREARFR